MFPKSIIKSAVAHSLPYYNLKPEKLSWLPIITLAKQRNFSEIEQILRSENVDDVISWLVAVDCATTSREFSSFIGETVLHKILIYRPTVEVVDLMIRLLKKASGNVQNPELVVDVKGRTPLHVAAAAGCDLLVIQRLMSNVRSAKTQDRMERYPLHWACTNPQRHVVYTSHHGNVLTQPFVQAFSFLTSTATGLISQGESEDIKIMIHVISTLIWIYPKAVSVADSDGKTPLQLAKENKACATIIRLLESVVEIGVDKFTEKRSRSIKASGRIKAEGFNQVDDHWDQLKASLTSNMKEQIEFVSGSFALPFVFINNDDDDDASSIGWFSVGKGLAEGHRFSTRVDNPNRKCTSKSPVRRRTIRKTLSDPTFLDMIRLEI